MAENSDCIGEVCNPPPGDNQHKEEMPTEEVRNESAEPKKESEAISDSVTICANKDESGVVIETADCKNVTVELKTQNSFAEIECEVNDDVKSVGDLDSLPVGDELTLCAAGSDSGVEGCGRALSSGGGSRSCASSVVSCGSGCGSESSSLAGAPPRPRRRVNITGEPKRSSPIGSSTPRPVTAPRGPNLATRERARSREKPIPPEKPRPLTPKPRIRPTADLPNLIRESPALRAKPTKTSTARCRTPNSPSEDKRWPANGSRLATVADASATRVAADKYGTLPRKRRDINEAEGSPKQENTPPSSRRPTITRSITSRSTIKTRVRIYAEKTSQTVLTGTDIESALAGIIPNIESRIEVTKCHRGVQANARDLEMSRLTAAVATAEAAAAEERDRRLHLEKQLAAERAGRLAAMAELESNSKKLLELVGAGAEAGADACLRALEEQLRSAGELSAKQRAEIDTLREHCDKLHNEACTARETVRLLEARLLEAEREAAEMQDFLAAETGALGDSLQEAEAELAQTQKDLERSRSECRQLVRMCEQRRQEALAAAARARGGGAAAALDALARRLRALTRAVLRAYALPTDAAQPAVYHNDVFTAHTPEEERPPAAAGGGLLAALARALRAAPPDDDRSRLSDDNDNSADLLDSETEPCLVTDPEYAEEWWSGAEGGGAWSADELSPEREWAAGEEGGGDSERDSLRSLSAAIAYRQREEAEDTERGALLDRVLAADTTLSDLLRALRAAAHTARDRDAQRLAHALREKIDITEKNVADVVVKKLAELDASKNMMEQYRQSIETLKNQLAHSGEEDFEFIEQEVLCCEESEREEVSEALRSAAGVLAGRRARRAHTVARRLLALAAALNESIPSPPDTAPAPSPSPSPATPLRPAPPPLHTAA